jgi:chorismate mutase
MPALMTGNERLWAVRGAVKVASNDVEAILGATEELMRELMLRNGIEPDRIVSCMFTATDDLNAEFPAVAARRLGLDSVPLLCTRELDVPGAMRGVIRVLVHYYAPGDHAPAHTYLGEAQKLRSDLDAAQ